MNVFTSHAAARLAGITYRQLDYWARSDLLRPSYVDATGSGSRRVYTAEDVLGLRIVGSLLSKGVHHATIREALQWLDARTTDYLWVQDGSVGGGDYVDLLDALRYVQETIVLNVAAMRSDLLGAMVDNGG